MRKLLFILLGLCCCIHFAADADPVSAPLGPGSMVVLSVDHTSADQWGCEREYNSDLNLPRVVHEAMPTVSAPVLIRNEQSAIGHSVYADDGYSETLKETLNLKYSNLFAGANAVDYYIYRLHRLII